jgi:cytochrome c-type biogenesis protein CcmE
MRLRKKQRLILVLVALGLLGGASALVLSAMGDSVAFFATPSDIASGQVEPDRRFRLGGLVVPGSIERADGGRVSFRLTDEASEVQVTYQGILPDLFREGQGIVAQGTLGAGGTFVASEVLAKHDENYMPPEVAEALKRAGKWQHDGSGTGGDES